jgi:glutathione synthase/RimK-type ligase-like ATP-grasp enzyme
MASWDSGLTNVSTARRERGDPAGSPSTDAPLHSLVLVHTPGAQARSDFETIANNISDLDTRIKVHIATNSTPNERINRRIASTPTLVFSPIRLDKFVPVRGKIYLGEMISKLKQYETFNQRGIGTPKTGLLKRNTVYSEQDWGERVVLKPLSQMLQSKGRGVYLISTKRLNYDIHVGNMFNRYNVPGGVLVQQFVNTGPELEYHRVLALFGEPLYVMRTALAEPISLDLEAHPNQTVPIANQSYGGGRKDLRFVDGPEFHELALACFEAFPDRALQAIDVVRCHDTGRFYVLEVNAGGNTWHFSSAMITKRLHNQSAVRRLTARKLRQFGAFEVAARVLAERTRLEAQ